MGQLLRHAMFISYHASPASMQYLNFAKTMTMRTMHLGSIILITSCGSDARKWLPRVWLGNVSQWGMPHLPGVISNTTHIHKKYLSLIIHCWFLDLKLYRLNDNQHWAVGRRKRQSKLRSFWKGSWGTGVTVLARMIGCNWAEVDCSGLYCAGMYWDVLGCNWAVLDCTYWAVLGCAGL